MKKETNVKEFLMKYGFVIILILVTAFFGITTNTVSYTHLTLPTNSRV